MKSDRKEKSNDAVQDQSDQNIQAMSIYSVVISDSKTKTFIFTFPLLTIVVPLTEHIMYMYDTILTLSELLTVNWTRASHGLSFDNPSDLTQRS